MKKLIFPNASNEKIGFHHKRLEKQLFSSNFVFDKLFIPIIMKTIRLCFYLFVSGCFNSLWAQEELGNGMLFPQFEEGIVVFNNGARTPASLNYNTIWQQMLFLGDDSTVMSIAKPLDVRVVIIGERRFLPISSKGIFYEAIEAGEGSFFIKRETTILSEGKAAGYGGYSQTSSVTSYGSWSDGFGTTTKLNPDEKFKLKSKYTYYLKSGNSYKSFVSAKTLGKLFKGHASEIEEFADRQSIDFSKTEDVARIVEYGYILISKS